MVVVVNIRTATSLTFSVSTKRTSGCLQNGTILQGTHGETAFDVIGGTAKCLLTLKVGQQRPASDQILTPQDMFSFCNENAPVCF